MKCPRCGGPTWTCTPPGYVGPVGSLLYAYASLLRPDDRYGFRRDDKGEVWCCDRCRKAGMNEVEMPVVSAVERRADQSPLRRLPEGSLELEGRNRVWSA